MKYELTFYEALDVLVNNKGWIQGENFADGVVLSLDSDYPDPEYLHVHDFSLPWNDNRKYELRITRGILSQKYRVVLTQPDAWRKVK